MSVRFLLCRAVTAGLLLVVLAAVPWGLGAGTDALAQEVRNPDGVAVIIGNRNYTNPDVPEVTFAHRDADAFRRHVIEVLGYDPENIIDLRDATRGQLFDILGAPADPHGLLWSYLNPDGGSDVVVFYSGHGVPGLKDGRGYLFPEDGNPKSAERDGYPIDLLYEMLGGLEEAETVRVYLDACFSGSSAGGAVIKDASPVYLTPKLPEGVGDRVVSLTAASGKQVASWDRERKHGLFTYHLLDALSGRGDADGDGQVTASEAKAYLDKYMTRAARRQHRRVQVASLLGSEGVVLASALSDGAFPARPDLDAPEPEPIIVETEDDSSGRSAPAALDLVEVTGGESILVVETEPPGATVLLNGANVGETPLRRYDLRSGSYTVTVDHPSYETVHLEGQILENKRVLSIQRTLAPATGSVTVITQPDGGWVEHEGERLSDSTPVTLDGLPSGSLVLTVGAAGHQPRRVEVAVPKGGVALVEQVLEEARFGTLTLELEPADARVTFAAGGGLYQHGVRLAEGQHGLRVTRQGYREASPVVTVSGDTHERITLEPVPQPFTVVTTPADAAVRFLDTSESYRTGMALLPGTYRVRVSAEGWETLEATIRHGTAPTRHAVKLKRSWNPAAEETALQLKRSEKELVQRGLAAAGFRPGKADGLIGDNTRKALRVWQAKQGHEATGYLTADEARTLIAVGRREAERKRPGEEFRGCPECPEMVVVPAGSFTMGSPPMEKWRSKNEGPQRRVTIREPFAVGKYEVTFAEWDACVVAGGCNNYRPRDTGWGRGRRPVINVSWKDTKAYVGWLSRKTGERYRLLSEAEWEYAARAGTTDLYQFGATISKYQASYERQNTLDANRKMTFPVGSFPANRFGLHDVHGNVWEWVEDCWHGNYENAPEDGSAWASGGDCDKRVLRGGSWINNASNLRSAARNEYAAGDRYDFAGFRVALTLPPRVLAAVARANK